MKTSPRTHAQPDADERAELRGALTNRKMSMIAIGGVIGAGLFVGSGSAIGEAGPAVVIAYAAIGLLVILVMRMLAELAVARPDTGSFSSYAGRELGPWAGLTIGWLYAYQWCVTVGFEAVVGATLVNGLLPQIPTWLAALVLMAALIAVNFARVESFGTFEFWFAMIKVAAIVAFLLIGLAAVLGMLPGADAPGMTNLTGRGGFAPQGWGAVLTASLVVFFSFFGSEVVTIAAGEAKDPARAVRKGINSVVWRILLFYIGSIALVVTLLPWNATAVAQSPYSAVLDHLGVPHAGTVMDFIVLTAVLSCLNSGIYSSSRMLHSLAERGEAPRLLARTTRQGVPAAAVVAASSIGLLTVVANYFLPSGTVYQFLLDSSGAVAVVVYIVIVVTHLRGRARLDRGGFEDREVRMWAYPYLDVIALAALLAVIGGMAVTDSSRRSLFLTLAITAVAIVAGTIHQRRRAAKS
ncbi:amino acid transporter [Streptomyces sp. CB01635]|uniref:amino acid permease n=1 Tax=unclassified Streptomyces TaxID=2593676 RepID=UPI000C26FFC0|nr:amino acid permease [Streptomyces sp. CB01635]PJN08595.1 amino acid transporter [Streptomyces sp. CB01635]